MLLLVFVAMALLANIAFAGGGYGPSASAGASASAGVDNNIGIGVNNNLTGINKNDNTNLNANSNKNDNTNLNTNLNANSNKNYNNNQQGQQQGQNQGQQQRSVNNNVVQSGVTPEQANVNYPAAAPAYMEERPRYNDLTDVKIRDGVSVFTRSSVDSFFCGLPKRDREILDHEVELVLYPAPPVSGAVAFETKFLHGKVPEGIEGRDYFIVGEFEINATPNEKASLLVRGNAFKYVAARKALELKANTFTILSSGSDAEQRNGAWGAGISTGGAGISGAAGMAIGGGVGYSQGWSKKQSRPWAYGKFYYVPPEAPVLVYAPPPPRSCSSQEERVDESLEQRSRCKHWCLQNLKNNWELGDAYMDLYVCTNDLKYAYDAIEAFRRAEMNFQKAHLENNEQAYWILRGDPKKSVYLLWTYAFKVTDGPERASAFAHNHGLNIDVNGLQGQGQ